MKQGLALLSTAAVFATTPCIAAAVDVADAASPQSTEKPDDRAIEDIVVTATRREASLQSIPLAEQIAQVVPSLVVVRNPGQTQFNLRGISSRGVYAGDENGVRF